MCGKVLFPHSSEYFLLLVESTFLSWSIVATDVIEVAHLVADAVVMCFVVGIVLQKLC